MDNWSRQAYRQKIQEIVRQRHSEWKHLINIVSLANNEHNHPSLNEEYEKLAKRYHDKEITREEFFEEYKLLKVALKLIDE
ncbi:hypothetical protein LCGC14_2426940 [marine sediment metagenome]|uniref:Uncharacterized protein n=1 Tax=marine sediment metagenome TaxID=412755 RepID=A0A0F9BN62_9ZZZZ